jgi:hypothetical protein
MHPSFARILGLWLIGSLAACNSARNDGAAGASGSFGAQTTSVAAFGHSGTGEATASAGHAADSGSAGARTAGASAVDRASVAGRPAGRPAGGGPAPAGNAASSSGGRSGSTASAPADLPMGVNALFPPPLGSSLCPDPPLRIGFASAPTLGTSGKIQVFNMSGSLVASVDMAATSITDTIGGTSFTLPRPVFVEGNDVVIQLKQKALGFAQSYSVTVEAGAIHPAGGGAFAIGGSSWRFSTAAAAPKDASALSVALDGSGNFCSVQGALDALPVSGTAAALISVGPGLYHEILHMRGKSNVTLRGADRKRTIIVGTNNNNLNPSTATRSLVGFDNTNGLRIENMTIHNLTPQGGSQAEALRLQGCDKCVVRNVDIVSLQDTLLWSGRIYADHCYIEGNVDYLWGTGVAYFNQCELQTVGRSGVIVQARNTTGGYGYVFVDSKLTADMAASSNMLARIDVSAYPASHVAYIDCQMTNIAAAGWTISGGAAGSALRFWEYQSTDASGKPLDFSGRANGSLRLSSSQAAMMRDPSSVLGGWQPR